MVGIKELFGRRTKNIGGVMVFAMFVLMGQQTQKAYATTQKESLVSLQRATEINKLDGVTATTAEINYLDITTLGASEASKVLTANASGIVTFNKAITEETVALTSRFQSLMSTERSII